MTAHRDDSACTGAVVRKPLVKERAGDGVATMTPALWRFDRGVDGGRKAREPGGEVMAGAGGSRVRFSSDGARLGERLRRRRIDFDRLLSRRRCQSEEFAHPRDRLGAVRAGKQAVVADAMEAFGQHVDQEAADELADVERHRGVAAGSLDPVVLDLERDAVLVDRDQAAVRDGDAVRVA
jgi:hypothetical protein